MGRKKTELNNRKRFWSLTAMLSAVAVSLYANEKIDMIAPAIYGVCDRTVTIGETVLYRDGVTAKDETDGALKVYIDTDSVNPVKAGQYEVIYSAADTSGNRTTVSALFTFTEPEPEPTPFIPYSNKRKPPYVPNFISPDKFADKPSAEEADDSGQSRILEKRPITAILDEDYPLEVLNKELASDCDKVLDSIIKPEMTSYDKARAIFYWVRSHIWYAKGDGHPDDWQVAATDAYNTHSGNCYHYFALSKALLQRAGLHTIDVEKIYYSWRSMHYWELVWCETPEYGWGWYHFDTTPRINGADYFLWTDKQMLDFSKRHGNCFDFDLDLYPRTPGEPVG